MSQATTWGVPRSGPITPTAYATRDDEALDALLSMHKGSSAPSYAVAGTLWCDDATATLLGIKFYDGSDWILLYQIDVTNNRIVFPMAGVVDVASATTTDLGAVTSNQVRITGTTTITGLGTAAAGTWRLIRFAGALTFTHNATSLILPGGANITTAAGDTALVVSEGSGNWRCHWYQVAALAPGNANDADTLDGVEVAAMGQLGAAAEWTKRQNFNETSLTSSSNSVAWDVADNQVAAHTLTENTTIAAPSNAPAGTFCALRVTQHASAAKTLAWNSVFKAAGGTMPTMTSTTGAVDLYVFWTDGTNFYLVGYQQDLS